jgi:hypothetical protein
MISELDHPNDYFVLAMIQYVKEALTLKYERCDIGVQKNVSLQSHYNISYASVAVVASIT